MNDGRFGAYIRGSLSLSPFSALALSLRCWGWDGRSSRALRPIFGSIRPPLLCFPLAGEIAGTGRPCRDQARGDRDRFRCPSRTSQHLRRRVTPHSNPLHYSNFQFLRSVLSVWVSRIVWSLLIILNRIIESQISKLGLSFFFVLFRLSRSRVLVMVSWLVNQASCWS